MVHIFTLSLAGSHEMNFIPFAPKLYLLSIHFGVKKRSVYSDSVKYIRQLNKVIIFIF